MPKKKENKEKGDKAKIGEIDSLVEALRNKFGEEAIMKLGEARRADIDVISTGSLSLDLALGVGGLPRGRIVEIYGPEASGKTTLALHVVSEAQKVGGKVAFIDAEHALDPEYAKNIGVKTKELLISQPSSGEEALNILESLVRSAMVSIVVIDSVAALTPRAEIEGEMGDMHIGLQARLMSQALRKITALATKTGTMIIFINQLREKIGVMFGNPETTPGGRALKFYASVRLDIRRIAQVKKGDKVVGHRAKVKVAKNKVAPPFRVAEFDIIFGKGISYEGDVLNVALDQGVVKRSGSTYTFGNEKIAVGLENARVKLQEDNKLLNQIKKETLRVLKGASSEI